jgi:2-polyprenyl-6-hydroxyphenyl methylase / 3-demethylubiquinone-9 3-methyltransferase
MNRSAGNVDAAELRKFADLADRWWAADGPFKTLHDINPLRVDYIAARVALAGARVLDVGCGGGLLSEALAARGADVVGLDLAPENVAAAQAHAAVEGRTIDYRCVDVAAVAAAGPGSFDVVCCLELLEHVPDPDAVVTACAAAARPGGTLFFSTVNRNVKSFALAIVGAEYLLRLLPAGTHHYSKLVKPAELAAACRHAGLVVRELTGLHYNPLTKAYRLGGNVDVNYLMHALKPEQR